MIITCKSSPRRNDDLKSNHHILVMWFNHYVYHTYIIIILIIPSLLFVYVLVVGPLPLVEEKMRLLVNPIRAMIKSGKHRVISSQPIAARHHRFCNVTFELRVSTGPMVDRTTGDSEHGQKYMTAELHLQQGASGLEETFPLQAHLSVKKPHYSPKQSKQKPVVPKTELRKSTKDKPGPVRYLHEQRILLDLPTHCLSSDENKLQHVASFTNIISHKNFMDKKLVSTPFLDLKLVLTEFNSL